MLTAAQLAARAGKVNASFCPKLMTGDQPAIMNEWAGLVGDPAYQPADLSDVWAPMYGAYLETFSLDWHERKTGRSITRRGESVVHPARPYVGATLDGYVPVTDTVLDNKCPGAHRKIDDVVSYYTAQMIVQRRCVGADNAALLIVHGGAEPVEVPVTWDADYEAELWRRVDAFWQCVENLVPPFSIPPVAAPVRAERIVDMQGQNEWADAAITWLESRDSAKQFDAAAKMIKSLLPEDCLRAFGHGIAAARSRAGAITIREDAS